MSDEMPYPSARYRELSEEQVASFVKAFQVAFVRSLSEFRPEVVHIHHAWVLMSLLTDLEEPTRVVSVHGTDLQQARIAPGPRGIAESGVFWVQRFLPVSHGVASELSRAFGIGPERIEVIGNGFDPTIFFPRPRDPFLDKPVILAAGKLAPWKGFEYLIRAVALGESDLDLVILGTGPPDRVLTLSSLARREGIGHRVHLPGHVSPQDLSRWMARAAVFVVPSLEEPFGLVLLEALACGCPLVTSDTAGARDVLTQAVLDTGLVEVVPPLNPRLEDADRFVLSLADAIDRMTRVQLRESQAKELSLLVRGRTWNGVAANIRTTYQRTRDQAASGAQ